MPTLVHLVYIHGFQGNDTTFQSFPKHLQEYLSSHIPPHLDITIQSSLYPTYKSVKPISHATKNFLEWLSTQPPGPVILLGHSMGGLLAAEAATDPSNSPPNGGIYKTPGDKPRPKRIVGVVAFDTPYLGMHPHVVITGIASLLPKKDEDGKGKGEGQQQSEKKMNEHPQVHIVDEKVTDDWEAFKKQIHVRSPNSSYASSESSFLNSQDSLGSPSSLPAKSRSPSPSSPFIDRAVSFISNHSNDSVARWIKKHADDPISAAKRWVVEHFQFGVCMFDPSGLKARYTRLVSWEEDGGLWVNYWTNTVPRGLDVPVVQDTAEQIDNDEALRANGILPPSTSPPEFSLLPSIQPAQESEVRAEQKGKTKAPKKKKVKQARHFVVLPNGMGQVLGGMEKWEQVPISGVDDEVNAHTGLFIPHQNLEYGVLVERVAHRILGWCEQLPSVNHG